MLIFSTIPLTKYPSPIDITHENLINNQNEINNDSLKNSTIVIPKKDSINSLLTQKRFTTTEIKYQKEFINQSNEFISLQFHPDDLRYLWSYNEKLWVYRDENSNKSLVIYVLQPVDSREIFNYNKSYLPSIFLVFSEINSNGEFQIADENLVVIGDQKRSKGFTDISLQLLKHRGLSLNLLTPYYHHFNDEFNKFLKSCWRLSKKSLSNFTFKHPIKLHNKKSKLVTKWNYMYSKNHHWGLIWLTYGENYFEKNVILQHWHREMIPFNVTGQLIDFESFMTKTKLDDLITRNVVGLKDLNYLRNKNEIEAISKNVYENFKSGLMKRYHKDIKRMKVNLKLKKIFNWRKK